MAIRSGRKTAAAGPGAAAVAGGGFARALRRLRWPVALLWIAGIAALVQAAKGLARATDDTALAYLPSASQSAQVAAVQQEGQRASGARVSEQAIAVFARPGGPTPGDLAVVTAVRAAVGALVGPVRGLGSPGAVQRSADGGAALFTVPVSAPEDSVSSAALAQLPSVSVTEVGTAIATGVLLDTLLVRTVLVPAALIAIGDRAWWPRPVPPARPASA